MRYSVARMFQEPRLVSPLAGSQGAGSAHLFYLCSFRVSSERGCHILHGFQRAGAPDRVFRAGVGRSRNQLRESRTFGCWPFGASVSLRAVRRSREGRRRSGNRRRGSRTFWRLFSSLPVLRLAFCPRAFLRGAGREPKSGSWSQPSFLAPQHFFQGASSRGSSRVAVPFRAVAAASLAAEA
jgi:hypothetical protein